MPSNFNLGTFETDRSGSQNVTSRCGLNSPTPYEYGSFRMGFQMISLCISKVNIRLRIFHKYSTTGWGMQVGRCGLAKSSRHEPSLGQHKSFRMLPNLQRPSEFGTNWII